MSFDDDCRDRPGFQETDARCSRAMDGNPHVLTRLEACLKQLLAAHGGGGTMTTSSKGTEREFFVELFLRNIFSPAFRFGTGDITDTSGARSGQIDIVIENYSVPSFPLVGASIPRLYLAEGIGAALEVKSDIAHQWDDVVATAKQLAAVKRFAGTPSETVVPLIAVGYKGWKTRQTICEKFNEAQLGGYPLQGILTLEPARYVGIHTFFEPSTQVIEGIGAIPGIPQQRWVTFTVDGPAALWGVLKHLHSLVGSLLAAPMLLDAYGARLGPIEVEAPKANVEAAAAKKSGKTANKAARK